MDYRIQIAGRAQRDLKSIWQFIAHDDRTAAEAFREELLRQAESLKALPHRNPIFATRPPSRKLSYRSYIIFYRIREPEREIVILRFWHGARDPRSLRLKESVPTYSATASSV